MVWKIKGCRRCGGDVSLEDGLWRCLQCGRYYCLERSGLIGPPLGEGHVVPTEADEPGAGHGMPVARATRTVNSIIRATAMSEGRWWARNKETIAFLDEGRSVRDIAGLTARAQRQIRHVRGKLADLRAQDSD